MGGVGFRGLGFRGHDYEVWDVGFRASGLEFRALITEKQTEKDMNNEMGGPTVDT